MNTMSATPAVVSTQGRVHWTRAENLLVAEMSDLPGFDSEGRIILQSHKTGNLVMFKVAKVHRDREGDLTHWDLRPVLRSYHHLPTLRVFND